ncbi:MAG TPA: ATP-binding protein [Mycobacteriales bacterium]|nr:ATP-binding protein [Mycobacteriales bacterium]
MSRSGIADPFGTAAIRSGVLASWSGSPDRFREDANAEEDLTLGSYRDRLVVELAQNASDAALRAGVPGVLRLSVADGVLGAANTGAPLDAAGVRALATLRASAKRGGTTVGRFGVGFAAVLAVSDEPSVVSAGGGVRFSRADTAVAVAQVAGLAGELARRGGQVPVLRLPWACDGAPPAGFDTQVRLPLRPSAEPVARAALAAVSAELLLALPGLERIEVDGRVLTRTGGASGVPPDVASSGASDGVVELRDGATARTWRVRRRTGELAAELLADRPVEERERPQWTVTWAVPVGADGGPEPMPPGQVVHAPTPSDEPLSLPARLLATFPLDPARRRVAAGPLTDFLVGQVAAGYAELVAALPATPSVLGLAPRPGLAAAELDARICSAALAELRHRPWLPVVAAVPADGDAGAGDRLAPERVAPARAAADPAAAERVAPARACVLDAAGPDLVAALADLLPGLLPDGWSGRRLAAVLDPLGVRRLSTADIAELVSGVDRPPSWWQRLYAALERATLEQADREALAGLPVPLADGRLVTGPRGLLVPAVELPAVGLEVLGLRVVHPDAAHPLLERLGAVPATARGVLADGRVRAAVEASYDEPDPEPVAAVVLGLVRAAGVAPGELPWLAELALPTEDGGWAPAGELLLPGSELAAVVSADSPFGVVDRSWVRRWGELVLGATGVLRTFTVLDVSDVDTAAAEHDLDGEEDYYDALADRLPAQDTPVRLAGLVAVRDLELVRGDAWPRALALLAAPPLRAAVERPAIALLADGSRVEVPSYTRWWLASHPVLAGRRPAELRLPAAVELAGLYDEAPGDPGWPGDPDLLALLGCLSTVDDVLADPELAAELVARLGDPDRRVDGGLLRRVYGLLAGMLDGYDVSPPARVRVAPELVVPAADAVVLDAPYLLPLLGGSPVVPAGGQPLPVADLLDLPLASELVSGRVESEPAETVAWPDVPGAALAAERCGATAVPSALVARHAELRVAGRVVPWWPAGEVDHVHASAGAAALGRALAWRLGQWRWRAAAVEALTRADPAGVATLRAEDAAG